MAEESLKVCSICLVTINPNQATYLPCAHAYCSTCIESWLKIKPTCPVCRTPATGVDTQQNASIPTFDRLLENIAGFHRQYITPDISEIEIFGAFREQLAYDYTQRSIHLGDPRQRDDFRVLQRRIDIQIGTGCHGVFGAPDNNCWQFDKCIVGPRHSGRSTVLLENFFNSTSTHRVYVGMNKSQCNHARKAILRCPYIKNLHAFFLCKQKTVLKTMENAIRVIAESFAKNFAENSSSNLSVEVFVDDADFFEAETARGLSQVIADMKHDDRLAGAYLTCAFLNQRTLNTFPNF